MTCHSMKDLAAEELRRSTAPFRQSIAHRLDVHGPPVGGPSPPLPRQDTCVIPPPWADAPFYMTDAVAAPSTSGTRRKGGN